MATVEYGLEWSNTDLLRALFHALPIGVCVTDENAVFVYVNEAYCRIYGYRAEEMVGERFLLVVPEDQHELLQQMHDDFIAGAEELPSSFDVKRRNGDVIAVNVTAARFRGNNGKYFKVTTVMDITERLRLRRLRDDAERIVRHDLKNPLSGMMVGAQLLLKDPTVPAAAKDYARYIEESGVRMERMLNYSMNVFHMEEGSYRLDPQPFDLVDVFEVVEREVKDTVRRRGVALQFTVDSTGSPQTFPMIGEPDLIESMLGNLVRNAVEASGTGEHVSVSARTRQFHEIEIHNPAPVPESIRDRFFDRYVTTKKEGTGLGTHSARLIARTHGGDVHMSTSEKEGTRVTVVLPHNVGSD